mmetsp:Transcript_85390/g.226714  ORF Transcript_85390/g.226714 Transcript_85390/m.226714 type:complete len:425 (+) Transcript_85390:241-1515(+)
MDLLGEAGHGRLVELQVGAGEVVHQRHGLRLPALHVVLLVLDLDQVVGHVGAIELAPGIPVPAVAVRRENVVDLGVEEADGLLVGLGDADKVGVLHVLDRLLCLGLGAVVEGAAPATEVLHLEVQGTVAMEGHHGVRHIPLEVDLLVGVRAGAKVAHQGPLVQDLVPVLDPGLELVHLRPSGKGALGAVEELREHVRPGIPNHGDYAVHVREPVLPRVATLLAKHRQGGVVHHHPDGVRHEGCAASPRDVHVVEIHHLVVAAEDLHVPCAVAVGDGRRLGLHLLRGRRCNHDGDDPAKGAVTVRPHGRLNLLVQEGLDLLVKSSGRALLQVVPLPQQLPLELAALRRRQPACVDEVEELLPLQRAVLLDLRVVEGRQDRVGAVLPRQPRGRAPLAILHEECSRRPRATEAQQRAQEAARHPWPG